MGADTLVVKKNNEWIPMVGEEEWMEKHRDMEGKKKRRWESTRVVAQDSRANPNSLETHLERKWGSIAHQRVVGPNIYNTNRPTIQIVKCLAI